MEKQQKNGMFLFDEDIDTSERQNSMCAGGFEIPIASRVIEFEEEDYVTNFQVTGFSEELVYDKDYQKLTETALVLTNGAEMYHIYEYYPICLYKCNEKCELQPTNYLNSFVKSISLIIVGNCGGKCYSVASGKMEVEPMGYEYVCYYTGIYGSNYLINQADICDFLLKKPKLVVSNEGVLIFYNKKHILSTLDCNHYTWEGIIEDVDNYDIIEITSDCNKNVIKVFNLDSGETSEYCIKFDIDPLNHGLISHHLE